MARKSSANRSCDDNSFPQGTVALAAIIIIFALGVLLILRGLG